MLTNTNPYERAFDHLGHLQDRLQRLAVQMQTAPPSPDPLIEQHALLLNQALAQCQPTRVAV